MKRLVSFSVRDFSMSNSATAVCRLAGLRTKGPRRGRTALHLALAGITAAAVGCTIVQPAPTPIARLEGRGVQWVSGSNEYLAANRAVQSLVEASDDLRGFIERQGQPEYINVPQRTFDYSEVQLFYPRNDNWYRIRYEKGGWFVEGPLPLSPDERAQLESIPATGPANGIGASLPAAQPVLPRGPGHSAAADEAQSSAIQERAIPLAESPGGESSMGQPAEAGTGSAVRAELPRVQGSQVNVRTQAGLEALIHTYGKELAETTPKGDLVHYVTFTGENLKMIARWYTMDENNTERLSRINELRRPNALQVGDMVVVPRYLVKNGFRMTQEAVDAMR